MIELLLIAQAAGMAFAAYMLLRTSGPPKGAIDALGTAILTVLWPVPLFFLIWGMAEGAIYRARGKRQRGDRIVCFQCEDKPFPCADCQLAMARMDAR